MIDPQRMLGLCPKCLLTGAIEQIGFDDHHSLRGMQQTGRCPSVAELGAQIVGYKFHELLGRGGSGWTFLATQESLSRQVAVKVIRRKVGFPDSMKLFRAEAESLAKLNHAGIVTVHSSGVTTDYLYLVMEYVPGPTLRQRLEVGKLSVTQALKIARQICAAVQSAHHAGIAHRDIKPENILFNSDAEDASIKVADFGIARLLDTDRDRAATVGGATLGMVAGTPFYMSPEQSENNPAVALQCDIYSIGVVVYEMLTGRLPLGRFPAPSSLSECSTSVDHAVFHALQNQPADRTQTAQAFAKELDSTQSSSSWPSPWPIIAAAIAVTMLLILFSLALALALGGLPTDSSTSPIDDPASVAPASVDPDNPFLKDWSDVLDNPSEEAAEPSALDPG